MAYDRPTLQQLKDRILADLKVKVGTNSSFLRRSWLTIFAVVIAGAVHLLYGAIQYVLRQLFTVTADDDSIIKKAKGYGITRKPPAFAAGIGKFTGNNGVTIPALTTLVRGDQVRFQTTAPVDISGGVAFVPIRAVVAGALGNTPIDTQLEIEASLGGVSDAVLVTTAFTGGTDLETIAQLKARLLQREQNPPHGGAKSDYEFWARELTDVGTVKVYAPGDIAGTPESFTNGPNYVPPVGEVWVYFSTSTGATPSSEAIAAMQTYLNKKKPATATVRVYGTQIVYIQIKARIKPSLSSTYSIAKEDVKNQLIDLLDDVALPTSTIYLSQINEAISRPSSEVDHQLIIPVANITLGVNQIGKLDTAYYDANVSQLP